MTQVEINDYASAIERGREAWKRLSHDSTWEDWLSVGTALEIGREESMRAAYTREATGRAYNEAMAEWLAKNGFADIDKGVRSRLRDVMANLADITAWRQTLAMSERLKLNHPNTVIRRWRATLPTTGGAGSRRPDSRAEIARLKAEVKRLVHNGGSQVAPDDRAEDIADWLVRALPEPKLRRVLDRCWELLIAEGAIASEAVKDAKSAARDRALAMVRAAK